MRAATRRRGSTPPSRPRRRRRARSASARSMRTAPSRTGCRQLDGPPPTVGALHREVLDGPIRRGASRYVPDAHEADAALRRGDAVAVYLLPPTTPGRIRAVVERGERLPQKSTYFWPKPRTGMVMMPLDPAPDSLQIRWTRSRIELLDAARDHLREAASPGAAPVEASDELAVHEHRDRPWRSRPALARRPWRATPRSGGGGGACPSPERRA